MTGVTSSWASCGVSTSKGTRGSDDDAVPEICSDSTSLYPVRVILCQHEKMKQLEKFRPSQDGIGSTTLRPLRAGHPSSRTKFPGASVKSDQVPRAKQERTSHCFVSLGMMHIHTE